MSPREKAQQDALRSVAALVKDTDYEWLPGDSFDGLAGEIQAVLIDLRERLSAIYDLEEES